MRKRCNATIEPDGSGGLGDSAQTLTNAFKIDAPFGRVFILYQ
jgi:hypothetical protein